MMNKVVIPGFPELTAYDLNPQGQYQLSLEPETYWAAARFDTTEIQQDVIISNAFEDDSFSGFEVAFHVQTTEFFCFLTARNAAEALGWFKVTHPNISYNMVDDIMEV